LANRQAQGSQPDHLQRHLVRAISQCSTFVSTFNLISRAEKTKSLQEVDLLPDILIWPIGISKWLQPVPSTPTNLIPIAEADHIGFSRRTHVISSFEDDENNVRLLLEERESRGLAGTNAFYFLLTSNSDLRFHINTKTGHVLRSPERIHNHCDRCNYDDYELMRSLTKTISTHRYWVLNVENISCLQCVEELQEKRRKVSRALVRMLTSRG
jgi:hypothetical protein